MNSKHVLILGAGVSGLTTALKLVQAGHQVTLWSKEQDGQSPATSLNAYAMWVPVKYDTDPRFERWANETRVSLEEISQDPAAGIVLRQICKLKMTQEEPWYANVAGFRHACPGEISCEYHDAHVFEQAPVIDPFVYISWLYKQVQQAGAKFVQREIQQLSDCSKEFSVIINCTSLGSRQLIGDQDLHPERVQVVKIKSNGFDKVVIDDEGPHKRACIVPHRNYIKLGAVFDGRNESMEVDDKLTADIIQRCCRIAPGFKADLSDVLSVSRCLRPERSIPRVELGKLNDGRTIIHNYGHDGMGYILSYGIAAEVVSYLSSL